MFKNGKIPEFLYHATYERLIESIKVNGLGGDHAAKNKMWEGSKDGLVYLAVEDQVALSYAEISENATDEDIDQIVLLRINTKNLFVHKFSLDENVIDNNGDTLQYNGVVPPEEIMVVA
jgi:hypothetical protein